jgi:hypothetical protein
MWSLSPDGTTLALPLADSRLVDRKMLFVNTTRDAGANDREVTIGPRLLPKWSAFAADGKHVFLTRVDGTASEVARIDLEGRGEVVADTTDDPVGRVMVSHDGKTLAVERRTTSALLWLVEPGAR